MCNLRCPFCPVGNGKISHSLMTLEDHKKIIDLLPKYVKLIRYSYRGDATLNPNCVKMIKYAHDSGFKTDMSTNGMLVGNYIDQLVSSGLDRIIFAVDGATQKVQQTYRIGSDINTIKDNIKRLIEARKSSQNRFPKEIIMQTVVSSNNEEQIDEIVKMADELGVDKIKFKTLAVNLGGDFLQGREEQESYLPKNKEYWREGSDILLCPALGETVILSSGDVSICCSDFEGKYIMGNIIEENSFEKIIRSIKYNLTRKQILKKNLPICKDCPMTGIYWISSVSKKFNRN
ncbi:MAG: radical SAM protein [bacterium]